MNVLGVGLHVQERHGTAHRLEEIWTLHKHVAHEETTVRTATNREMTCRSKAVGVNQILRHLQRTTEQSPIIQYQCRHHISTCVRPIVQTRQHVMETYRDEVLICLVAVGLQSALVPSRTEFTTSTDVRHDVDVVCVTSFCRYQTKEDQQRRINSEITTQSSQQQYRHKQQSS